MNNFFIAIPTINRADLLNEALEKYIHDFPNIDILVLDNGRQNIFCGSDNLHVFQSDENKGVAASWNWLLKKGFELGYKHALILNDDIYLGKLENEVQAYIDSHKDKGFMVGMGVNWCAFILSKKTTDLIGFFDEVFFPAYYEDNDYCWRMRLGGILRDQSQFLIPVVYRNSMTIQKDPSLNSNFEKNKQYFIKKWGGIPNYEIYKKPFNE